MKRLRKSFKIRKVNCECSPYRNSMMHTCRRVPGSVTRLGDLWDFGQLFKACGNNKFAPIYHILRQFCKGVKIFNFSSETIFRKLFQAFGDFLLVTLGSEDGKKLSLASSKKCFNKEKFSFKVAKGNVFRYLPV